MLFKRICLSLVILLYIFPFQSIHAQVSNVGFIPASIWYSKDPFEEGDKIKIYTVVYNPDNRELSGTVIFFDNSTLLGKKDITVPVKSVRDVSIDWTVTTGNHVIFAKIENTKFLISKNKYEDVYLAENKTEESKKSVSKKIISDLPSKIIDSTEAVSNVQNIIKENTPEFVTKTFDYTINSLEKLRTNTDNLLDSKKVSVQDELDSINNKDISIDKLPSLDGTKDKIAVKEKLTNTETSNKILKPFKYAELFLIKVFSIIFNSKILFYGLIIFIIFLTLRFFWRLIF